MVKLRRMMMAMAATLGCLSERGNPFTMIITNSLPFLYTNKKGQVWYIKPDLDDENWKYFEEEYRK